MNDLKFVMADKSKLKIKKSLEKAAKITLELGRRNKIIYYISKTEVPLFVKLKTRN